MLIASLAALAAMSIMPQQAAPQNPADPQRVSPRGSYSRSCSGDYVNLGRLYADCRDQRGRVRGTSIELNRCGNYEITNNNGLLVCGPVRGDYENRPGDGGRDRRDRRDRDYDHDRDGRDGRDGWGGRGGWGNGRSAITIYRDADYRGASFRLEDEVTNLGRTGFNDTISSMRIQGEWEACTDAYFRGQCQIFRDDVRNLSGTGMNDRISSLRPVRRGRY